MDIGKFSRIISILFLKISFLYIGIILSQKIDVDRYQIMGSDRSSCRKYQDIKTKYKVLENTLNGLKYKCQNGYNAFSQDISEHPLLRENECTVKNAKYIITRLEYTELLISRISQYCKTSENGTSSILDEEITLSQTKGTTEKSSGLPVGDTTTSSTSIRISTTTSFDGTPQVDTTPSSNTDYSLKVLNPTMQEAIMNNYPGNEVWYPPLTSFLASQVQYRTCFIKVGSINSNTGLRFRVISRNDNFTLLGIHEKGLTNGSTCIEYRCSVRNPDFDLNMAGSNDFYRYPKTYTNVQIFPIGQSCYVSDESRILRSQEKTNMGFSSNQSNVGNQTFEAFIPDNEYEGIYFHKSNTFTDIDSARETAIKECNTGIHSSFSNAMIPGVGLAVTFSCIP